MNVLNNSFDEQNPHQAPSWFRNYIRKKSHDGSSRTSTPSHQSYEVNRPVYTVENFNSEYGIDKKKISDQDKLRQKISKSMSCSKEKICASIWSFFPILTWFPVWLKDWKLNLFADVLAGLTVGIMSIPQGMAFTRLAGLNPIYGLYTNFIPTILYIFLGSAHHAAVGTAAVLSLMMGVIRFKHLPYTELDGPPTVSQSNDSSTMPTYDFTPIELAESVAMLIGLLLLLMGIFRLGFVSNYLSDQLVGGFTSGAAVHVFTSQIDSIFGLTLPKFSQIGEFFFVYSEFFSRIKETNVATLIISIICIGFLLLCKEYLDRFVQKRVHVPIPSELILEFYAYGTLNIIGSFFQCYPCSQSCDRSIVYDGAGAKSQLAGFIGAMLVIVVILWIAPYLYFLPQCCLGSITIVACINILKHMKELKHIWRASKIDFSIYMVTFLSVVFLNIPYGLAVSVVYALLSSVLRTQCQNVQILGRVADTEMYDKVEGESKVEELQGIKVVHFNDPLYYANVEKFKPNLYKRCNINIHDMKAELLSKRESSELSASDDSCLAIIRPTGFNKAPYCVIVDCSGFSYVDVMGINVLKQVYSELNEVGIEVFFAACNPSVHKMLRKVNVFDVIPMKAFYVSVHDAVLVAVKHVNEASSKESEDASSKLSSNFDHISDKVLQYEKKVNTSTESGIYIDSDSNSTRNHPTASGHYRTGKRLKPFREVSV